jgi:hypothetical protein
MAMTDGSEKKPLTDTVDTPFALAHPEERDRFLLMLSDPEHGKPRNGPPKTLWQAMDLGNTLAPLDLTAEEKRCWEYNRLIQQASRLTEPHFEEHRNAALFAASMYAPRSPSGKVS